MKKILIGAASLAALAAFAGPALAADMPARPYTKAPAYTAPAVVYNWTGFYIGGHVGGAFAGNNSLVSSDARFMGGVQVGVADFNHDGRFEIRTAPGAGRPSEVRAFDGVTQALLGEFEAFSNWASGTSLGGGRAS